MSFGPPGHGGLFDEWTRKIHEIMDEMLRRDFVRFRDSGVWQPATNVYETAEAYYICVELAGVSEEEIDVECSDRRRILIRGTRRQPRPQGVACMLSVHTLEIDDGRFERNIELPEPIDVDRVDARYGEGYLWITAPRTLPE